MRFEENESGHEDLTGAWMWARVGGYSATFGRSAVGRELTSKIHKQAAEPKERKFCVYYINKRQMKLSSMEQLRAAVRAGCPANN